MRPVVSLVETSPETVSEDYRRAMDLAGISPALGESSPLLLARVGRRGFEPGFSSPPWQLAGVLSYLQEAPHDGPGARVFPVHNQGPSRTETNLSDLGWGPVLEKSRSTLVPLAQRELEPLRVTANLPALGAVLPEGFCVPPAISGASVVLLPTPVLNRDWRLSGNVALLASLLAGRIRRDKRIPLSEILAEVVGLAREATSSLYSVMDATVWGVYREDGKAHPLIRNVVLAGKDPVAVDAVAARLAGLDPRRIAWLQLCTDRGLGESDPEKIVIQGRKDLMGLDFQFPKGTFSSGPGTGSLLSWPGRFLGALGQKKPGKDFAGSAWGRLLADYRSGVVE